MNSSDESREANVWLSAKKIHDDKLPAHEPMKLIFWRWMMVMAWTLDEYADGFVMWAQQKYSNELLGLGSIDG